MISSWTATFLWENCDQRDTIEEATFFPLALTRWGLGLRHLQLLTSVADAVGHTWLAIWQETKCRRAPLVDYVYFVYSKFSISNILILSSGAWKPVRDDLIKCHIFHLGKLRPKRRTQLIISLAANLARVNLAQKICKHFNKKIIALNKRYQRIKLTEISY